MRIPVDTSNNNIVDKLCDDIIITLSLTELINRVEIKKRNTLYYKAEELFELQFYVKMWHNE